MFQVRAQARTARSGDESTNHEAPRLPIHYILRCKFEEFFREPESKSKIVFGDRAKADEQWLYDGFIWSDSYLILNPSPKPCSILRVFEGL